MCVCIEYANDTIAKQPLGAASCASDARPTARCSNIRTNPRRMRSRLSNSPHLVDPVVGDGHGLHRLPVELGVLVLQVVGLGADRGERKVLTDNGSCYRSHTFADALGDIEHRRTRPYRPQTNGKVERFHRTLADEWAYARLYTSDTQRCTEFITWLHTYNHHRGHTALGGQPPATRVPNPSGQYNYSSRSPHARWATANASRSDSGSTAVLVAIVANAEARADTDTECSCATVTNSSKAASVVHRRNPIRIP
jgi:hypothetical protein